MPTSCLQEYSLGPVDAIPPGEGRAYRVEGREVAVFRSRSGEVYATQARCPHRGAPLADGLMGGGQVLCPFHAYAFDLATGEALNSTCPRLEVYPVSVSANGEIVLGLPPANLSVARTELRFEGDLLCSASAGAPTRLSTSSPGVNGDDILSEPLG